MVSVTRRYKSEETRAMQRTAVAGAALVAAAMTCNWQAGGMLCGLVATEATLMSGKKRTHHKEWRTIPFWTPDWWGPVETQNAVRFRKEHLSELQAALQIPDRVRKKKKFNVSGRYALCLFLYRLAHASTWPETSKKFDGRHPSQLSAIYHFVLNHVYNNFGYLLTDICLWERYMPALADAQAQKGSPYRNCIGYIDGTFRHIPRPVDDGSGVAGGPQRTCYNKHYAGHGLKYQAVTMPNGMIGDMYGPWEGARHDAAGYARSGLDARLAALHQRTNVNYVVYGDSAYALTQYLQPAYRIALNQQQRGLNHAMSGYRITVEWQFKEISQYWRFLDMEDNQKVNKNAPGKAFICAALMHNLWTIVMGGNQISIYFGCNSRPETMTKYLSGNF